MKLKQQQPAKFSTRAYNRCKICGRPHAYLRKALKKGYGPKELCALLKNEGIIIPAYLIRQFCSENGESLSVPSSDIDKAEDSTMSSSEGAELPEQLDVVTELGEGLSIQRNYERF